VNFQERVHDICKKSVTLLKESQTSNPKTNLKNTPPALNVRSFDQKAQGLKKNFKKL